VIVTELNGGLGNQLFQYAIGLALASKRSTTLRLDTSPFKDYPLRSFALGQFAITAKELTSWERRALKIKPTLLNGASRLIGRVLGRESMYLVQEKAFAFDPSVLDSPAMCYLRGYWQSPKYFAEIESQIREEFTVRVPLSGKNLEIAEKIAACAAVSLHVRRGDYVSNPLTNRYHGTCDPEYYREAEATLQRRVGEFCLFVFSDDPDWAEANLRFASSATILHHNGPERDYEDLRLMTLCRHHIVANSTFSWWGAWLCPDPAKIVIAPKYWFREANYSTDDLIPESWIRV
jgi:hypothetical protein